MGKLGPKTILLLIACAIFGNACGSASPPASIPAPVAGLISISQANDEGLVTIQASVGAFAANATVEIISIPATAAMFMDLLIASALAQTSVTAEANADGSLDPVQIEEGVRYTFTQTTAAGTSDSTEIEASDNAPALLDNAPVATAVFPSSLLGIVAHHDGTDSTIDFYSFTSGDKVLSFAVSNFLVSDMAADDTDGSIYVLDEANGAVGVLEASGDLQGGSTVALPAPPSAITALPGDDLAVIGFASASTSLGILDKSGTSPSLSMTIAVTHPSAATTVQDNFAVATDDDGSGTRVVGVLSRFDNNDTVLSIYSTPGPPAPISLVYQVIVGSSSYDDVVLFDGASFAAVSDTTNDQVIILGEAGFASTATVPAGDQPRGLAVDEGNGFGYVTNFGDNTISVFSNNGLNAALADTLTTVDGVGLGPVRLSLVSSPSVALIIANQSSASVSILINP